MHNYITYLLLFFLGSVFSQETGSYKFIENKGQWNDKVLLKSEINGGYLYLEKNGLTYNFFDSKTFGKYVDAHHHKMSKEPFDKLKCHSYKVNFIDNNANGKLSKTKKTSEYYNYYLGNDKSKWGSRAYGYGEVSYKEIWKWLRYHN